MRIALASVILWSARGSRHQVGGRGMTPLLLTAGLVLALGLPAASTARAGVPGPIRVSPDGRHFVDRTGAPFFWLGDTAWPLFTQYSREQAEAYLQNRGTKGFTVVQGVLAWGHGSGMEQKTPVANPFGQKPWLDDDPTRPNPAYFEHVDHLVSYADRHGLVLAMLPTWGYYVKEAPVLNATNARRTAAGSAPGTRTRPTSSG